MGDLHRRDRTNRPGLMHAILIVLACLWTLGLATSVRADSTGPLLQWNLDEGSGTVAGDSSGTGNAGTLSGGITWVPGVNGTAVSFDGASGAAKIASVSGLGSGNVPHTVAAWVKVTQLPANRAWILLLGNEGTGAHHWLINSSGVTQFGVWSGAQLNPALPVGQWTHVAITFDGSTLTGYVNGVAIGSKAATFNLQGDPLTVAQAHLGENYFNGAVDDVQVYDRALSAAEVAALAAVAPANQPPAVSLTAPAGGTSYTAPAGITLTADASDSDGSIARVDFYNGSTLLGSSTAAPYGFTWSDVSAGSYSLTAKATDNLGATATSAPVTVTVNGVAPTVSLTAPAGGATYAAPATVNLAATAAVSGGTISRVDFYNGTALLGSATAAPYGFTWSNVPAGSFSLTAKATDSLGNTATSAPVTVTVNGAAAAGIYYIYTDQLGAPRAITDTTNKVVWQWDSDPFGTAAPNEDPDGDGVKFSYNLRFSGQYYDQETRLHYNYFRDYDPETGRYIQPDPVGLEAGLNLYAYVNGNPLNKKDPYGLASVTVSFGGQALWGLSGGSAESGIGFDTKGNVCIVTTVCRPAETGTIGAFGGLGGSIEIEKGNFCDGSSASKSRNLAVSLGFGDAGSGSATTDENGRLTGGGRAFGGVGGGIGVSTLSCEIRTICTNVNPF